jgi:hypothetical protein
MGWAPRLSFWHKPITLNGETRALKDWTIRSQILPATICQRIKRGLSFHQALTTPDRKGACLRLPPELPENNYEGLYEALDLTFSEKFMVFSPYMNPRAAEPEPRLPHSIRHPVVELCRRNRLIINEWMQKNNVTHGDTDQFLPIPTSPLVLLGTDLERSALHVSFAHEHFHSLISHLRTCVALLTGPPVTDVTFGQPHKLRPNVKHWITTRDLITGQGTGAFLVADYPIILRHKLAEAFNQWCAASRPLLDPLLLRLVVLPELQGEGGRGLLQEAELADWRILFVIDFWHDLLNWRKDAAGLEMLGQIFGWAGDNYEHLRMMLGLEARLACLFPRALEVLAEEIKPRMPNG